MEKLWEKDGNQAVVLDPTPVMFVKEPVVAIAVPDPLGKLMLELERPFVIPAGTLNVRQRFAKTYATCVPAHRDELKAGELYLVRVLLPGNFLKAEVVEQFGNS